MKKAATVIILVILIMSVFAVFSAPHVKAQTMEATILSYSWYIAPANTVLAQYSGDLIAVGDVENTGTSDLSAVFIDGAAYNSSGAVVCSAHVQLNSVPELLLSQKAPSYLDFYPEESVTQDQSWVGTVTNVTLKVGTLTLSSQTPYSGLKIPTSSINQFSNSGTYTVMGTVKNNGAETTGNVWVLATFYHSSGKVVGMNCTKYLTSSLLPGNSVAFTATPADNTVQMSDEIANCSLLVESSALTSSNTTPNPTQNSSTPTPLSTASSSKPTVHQ